MDFIQHTCAIDKFYKNLDILCGELTATDKVVIFGTNKISGMMLYYLKQHRANVVAFIDNDKTRDGQIISDVEVYTPERLLGNFDDNYKILIVSGHQESMVNQLKSLGYSDKNIKIVIDLNKEMADFSHVDRTGYTPLNDVEIRQAQINTLKKFKAICDKHKLRYHLCGGTALGAVRHKGFIPWDDDIDVFLELEDMKKLVKIIKDYDDCEFITFVDEESDYIDEVSMFVDKSIIMDSNHFPIQLTCGCSIDVFYMSGVPDDEDELIKYAVKLKELEQFKWNKYYSKDDCKKANKAIVDYLSSIPYGSTNHVGCVLAPYFLREVYDFDSFNNPVYLPFEDDEYLVPRDYDTYLSQIYGPDYMTPPPKEKQVAHHGFKAYTRSE